MGAMFTAAEAAAWRRRFLAGASRSAEPPSGLSPLAALALTAQRDRFERPSSAETLDFGATVEDPRPILPEAARVPFRRLLRQKGGLAGQMLTRAAFLALGAAGVRPHPFDLPAAEPWMAQLEPWLGPAERAYRARLAGAPVGPIPDAWQDLSTVQRVSLARSRRQADPAAGRALIAQHLADEAAATRADLVEALSSGLGPDDCELLTALLADRSQVVRASAQALLARIPGSDAYGERLERAANACVLKKAGLFGGRRKFELTAAATDGRDPVNGVQEIFSGVRLGDLAARLGVEPEDLLTQAGGPLPAVALAACGLAEGRTDVLGVLAQPLSDYGAPFLAGRFQADLRPLPPKARARLVGGFIEAAPPAGLYPLAAWVNLLEVVETPLPAAAARLLLRSPAARESVAETQVEQTTPIALGALTGLAAATPRACAHELSALLASLGPMAGPARDFADFLSALPEDAR